MKRRAFIRSAAACAASAVMATGPEAVEARADASGITGYDYRLPKIKKGATLLLGQSRQLNPDLKIVLLEPFVLPVTRVKAAWAAWRGRIDRLRPVVAKLASEYKAILLKTQEFFDAAAKRATPSHGIWDGVHPLPQGHELIARNWIETVAKAWA